MGLKRASFHRRFFAILTILSFSFTQVLPAWALRQESASPVVKAGLESALRTGGTPSAVGVTTHAVAETLDQLVDYFSKQAKWIGVLEQSDENKATVLIDLLVAALRADEGTPLEITLGLSNPGVFLPLSLRLLTPGNKELHKKIDAQWETLQHECARCAAHIIHENLEESTRRDMADHPLRDILSSVMTAFDAARLGQIPTRAVKPGHGHTEREVVTQTAYSVSVVGGFRAVRASSSGGTGSDLIRSLAHILPRSPDETADLIPAVHVRALGSPRNAKGNHYVALQAIDLGRDRVTILDNGDIHEMKVKQFLDQYNPTGLLFLAPEQLDVLQDSGFSFEIPEENRLFEETGDCGTCAIKGDFPAGYHEPIEWALVSAARLLYRGADGGTIQVRYAVEGGEPLIRFYRVAYNSTTRELTLRVAEIDQNQRENVFYEEKLSVIQVSDRFGYKPDKIKRFMARILADLVHQDAYKISAGAKIIDVVTHFRWATHGPSDIKGTHPHQARPDEVRRLGGRPTFAKAVTTSHNGIIYDYYELGLQLIDTGHTFETAVDTERFAHLVWEIIDQERPPSLLEAVRRALARIRPNDTYGFQIISNDYPEEMISARNESPIYLGIGEKQQLDGKPVSFFMTAADPKAILPHTGVYSATLLPNRTIVQVKNGEMTIINLEGRQYDLVLPDGTISSGKRIDRQLSPTPVFVQRMDKDGQPLETAARMVTSLTREEIADYSAGRLFFKIFAADGTRMTNEELTGFVIFKKGQDQPEVYDLGEYPDYTTKELYQSGEGMRRTIQKNTISVPVYYIPRDVPLREGSVRAYRAADVPNRSNPVTIHLTMEQVQWIAGPAEWTELIHLPEGGYAFVKFVPNVGTHWYPSLRMPEFPGIPIYAWARLRNVDEVWGVSVGSSWNSDLDGFEYIRRYARIGAEIYNSDDLRDDYYWMNSGSGKKRIAVIATTQSGATAVTKADMEKIKTASGTPEAFGVEYITIADTNNPGSDITKPQYTEYEINEGLAPEIGVLSTEAVHSQKVNKELFGMRLGIERRVMRPEAVHDRIVQLEEGESRYVDQLLRDPAIEEELREIADAAIRTNVLIVAYRGPLSKGSAFETVIKLQEGGEINNQAFNMGTFLHGPAQLLQLSKVPVGAELVVDARYEEATGEIVPSVRYGMPEPPHQFRGYPIYVPYVQEEGDGDVRGRLESDFQKIVTRGASVYTITSTEYAEQLRQKKTEDKKPDGSTVEIPLVRRAIGVPASPYTLSAIGQKLALLIADMKNQRLADTLFGEAQNITLTLSADVPPGFSSREVWTRQALVSAYAQVVRLRESGLLPQVIHQENVGLTLSIINEAAQRPGDRQLVEKAADALAKLVNYIDVAQPGKLAKSVTVEAGLEGLDPLKPLELGTNDALQIKPSLKPQHDSEDTRNDWLVLKPIQTWLGKFGIEQVPIRFGDPLERIPALTQATGPESRPFYELTAKEGGRLTIAAAYRTVGGNPQRVVLVAQLGDVKHSARYWAIPWDTQAEGRLAILINSLVSISATAIPVLTSTEQITARGSAQVESLIQTLTELFRGQGVPQAGYFEQTVVAPPEEKAAPGTKLPAPKVRTTIVVVGPMNQAGLLDIPVHAVSKKDFNIHEAWTEDRPKDLGVSIVIVDASIDDLNSKGVLQSIDRRFKGGWEDRLAGFLEDEKGRDSTQVDWFLNLYRQYRENPQYIQDSQPRQDTENPDFENLSFMVAAFPYLQQRPRDVPPPITGVPQRVHDLTHSRGHSLWATDLFVTSFRETKTSPPVALVWMAFQNADFQIAGLDLPSMMKEFVEPYIAQPAVGTASPAATQAGLEGIPQVDVAQAIRDAAATSEFLKEIYEVGYRWHRMVDRHVSLTAKQIEQLRTQGNYGDLGHIKVDPGTDLTRIRNNEFVGDNYIGLLDGNIEIEVFATKPIGITGSHIYHSVIGPNAHIQDSTVSRQVVMANAVVVDSGVTASAKTTFGNGVEIPIAIETGGREVGLFAELSVKVAASWARYRGDKERLAKAKEALTAYAAKAVSTWGIIGSGARILRTPVVRDVYVGRAAVIDGANRVKNTTILSSPDEVTNVVNGADVTDSILQAGSKVDTMAIVETSLLAPHSHVDRHGKVTDSIIGSSTEVAEGEVTASLVGPLVGFHHQALLIAALWPEGKGNVGYGANVGSNHTSKAPDQEFWPGEGTFLGLSVDIKYPADLTRSPYSIVATGVKTLPQKVAFPFSLINSPAEVLGGISPAINELSPGWLLTDNMFTLARNEGKYKKRYKGKEPIEFGMYRPDIVDLVIDARARLQKEQKEIKPVYTEKDIPGLGKNYMKEESRLAGIQAYTDFIELYALRGFKAQVERLVQQGRASEVTNLLTQQTNDPVWEHQRALFATEAVLKAWSSRPRLLLTRLVGDEREVAEGVETSKRKDDERGVKIIDDYLEVHTSAENDAFVKATWDNFRELEAGVTGSDGLIAKLAAAGLEAPPAGIAPSGTVSFAALKQQLDSLPPLVLTSSDSVVQTIYGVVAGPQEFAPGLALSKQAYNADGLRVPVIFIARNEAQAAGLEALAVDPTFIYRVDPSGPYPTIAVAEQRASAVLASMGVTRVVPLGVTNPVPPLLLTLLENLFGIKLNDSPAIELWQKTITQAGLEIQA